MSQTTSADIRQATTPAGSGEEGTAAAPVSGKSTRKTVMESVLWALNVLAVVYLCFWALRKDAPPSKTTVRKKR